MINKTKYNYLCNIEKDIMLHYVIFILVLYSKQLRIANTCRRQAH